MPPRPIPAGGPIPAPTDDPDGPVADPIMTGLGAPLIEVPELPLDPVPPPFDYAAGTSKWPAERAYAYLASCPKVPVYVQMTDAERASGRTVYQDVGWQGWWVQVPKGRTVYVPSPLASLIEASQLRLASKQARDQRAIDLMLITPERPGGMLIVEQSDPYAVEMIRRGAPVGL